MLKTILDNNFCNIEYISSIKTVKVIYKRSLNTDEYQAAFGFVLNIFEETDAENYLSDTTNQTVVSMANQKWMETEVIPKAVKNGLKRIATVVPKDIFTKFYMNNVKKKISENKSGLEFQLFQSITDGENWLKTVQ